jgi:glutamate dehydrogenase/leucine dehydrogenase
MAKAQNLFDTAKLELDSIAQILETSYSDKKGLHSDKKRFHKAINLLKRPQNQIRKKLIVKLSNGKKKVFHSLRVQYNDANGPFMGGLRFDSNFNEENIKALAFHEALKSSIANISFGGAFGVVGVDINKVSLKDKERISKMFSQFLTPFIGVWKDIITTEKGTDEKTSSWMMESFERRKKMHSPASFTSNIAKLDGAIFILHSFLKSINYSTMFRKLDVSIHGFGNRGYLFAKNLTAQNFRVVAISDSTGGIVNSSGFDVEEIKKLKDKFGSLKEVSVMQKIEYVANIDLIKLPVDMLIVASKENVITRENADTITAKNILEIANFAITKDAEQILLKKSINILPDLFLNSGFTILAYLEWIQKTHGYKWSREEVNKKLHISMSKIFEDIKILVDDKKISYREACLYLGAKRIIDAMMDRGRV